MGLREIENGEPEGRSNTGQPYGLNIDAQTFRDRRTPWLAGQPLLAIGGQQMAAIRQRKRQNHGRRHAHHGRERHAQPDRQAQRGHDGKADHQQHQGREKHRAKDQQQADHHDHESERQNGVHRAPWPGPRA
jgi:hypothetical protein